MCEVNKSWVENRFLYFVALGVLHIMTANLRLFDGKRSET
jgi:hypothetical protein